MEELYANTHYAFELTKIYYITQAYLKIMYAKEGMKIKEEEFLFQQKWIMII